MEMGRNKIKCPKCKGMNVAPLGQVKSGFSVGKAVGGAVITGGIGLMAGFIGSRKGYDFYCQDCGYVYRVKKGLL